MSLKISNKPNFSIGLKNKVKEQCTEATDLIQNKSEVDPHEVIHELRKAFKKIRGALRLVRDDVDFYKEENAFFRDEGRRISDIRDATSVIEAMDDLSERYSDQLYKKTFSHFRDFLISRREEMQKDVVEQQKTLISIKEDLTKKCGQIDAWAINVESFKDISPSLERVYKRGREAFRKTQETKAPEDFHECRKRVKYLRYQMDLINRIWPNFLETWEDEYHDLSDYLGDDRDLFMLEGLVNKHRSEFTDPESYELLKSLINSRRNQLQTQALLLGNRLYEMDVDAFLDLIEAAWKAYDKEKVDLLV